jgi:hypothetical protein
MATILAQLRRDKPALHEEIVGPQLSPSEPAVGLSPN